MLPGDFSVTKLMAGMTQVLALGMMFLAFIFKLEDQQKYIMFAIMLQVLTIALLMMGRQR